VGIKKNSFSGDDFTSCGPQAVVVTDQWPGRCLTGV